MDFKKYKILLYLFVAATFCSILHLGILNFLEIPIANFHYSVVIVYGLYFVISALFYAALLFLADFDFTYVGITFLCGITLEFIISYILLRPILENKTPIASQEKVSFLVIFFLFVILQIILTVRLLNEKR